MELYLQDYCMNFCDEKGFMYRKSDLIRDRKRRRELATCVHHRYDIVECRSKLCDQFGAGEMDVYRDVMTECDGYRGGRVVNNIGRAQKILAPALPDASNMTPYMNRTFHVHELIVQCPRCMVFGRFRWWNITVNGTTVKQCRRRLTTVRRGWPSNAEKCDLYEAHQNRSYCELKEKASKDFLQFSTAV
ncbi:hypothetical protein AB6A40_010112 [Gnathostoma spinigerum]|uniref:Uncharacterized protein n=1 Tax=Gnathostoma spinigerum TaxID=75299 RepID=A0ABD6EUB5_9BILA